MYQYTNGYGYSWCCLQKVRLFEGFAKGKKGMGKPLVPCDML